MAEQNQKEGYELKKVEVRLALKEQPGLYSTQELSGPVQAIAVMSEAMKELDREMVCVVNLDSQLRPINYNIVTMGTVNSAAVPVQNVFKSAILSNANSIMLLHNHPSGNVEPSADDRRITKRLMEAGKLMGIPLTDHIIVGTGGMNWYSFYTEQAYLFQGEPDYEFLSDMIDEREEMYEFGDDWTEEDLASEIGENKAQYHKGKSRKEQMEEITKKLEDGIATFFTSDKYRQYLKTMTQFHQYSFNNTLLIAMQAPEATWVAGYKAWQQKFHRQVKKGERGIRIISPMKYKISEEGKQKDQSELSGGQGEVANHNSENAEETRTYFRVTSVFDISQTVGEPLPTLEVPDLEGNQKNYEGFMEALSSVSPVPIRFASIEEEGVKGYYSSQTKEIVIRQGLSQSQIMKTGVHECAHALLHDADYLKATGQVKDRQTKELEAESIAFSVCQFFGLDTGSYTFPYIGSWAGGRQKDALKESMDLIRKTSGKIVDGMVEKMQELQIMEAPEVNAEMSADQYEIYQIDKDSKSAGQMWLSYGYLKDHQMEVHPEDYRKVYEGAFAAGMTLESIYEKFNLNRPEDFKGHSLSVSDVVVLTSPKEKKAYYVNDMGFVAIPEFRKKPLKVLEAEKENSRKNESFKKNERKEEVALCR
ncbi:MAG: JAB domain-containing protein [Lachnospiraceae bacterium]|nr:JAB domain-containing protein [Lachnospiraceae bacterium]